MSGLADLKELRAQLSEASPDNDELFCRLVARGLDMTVTPDAKFAEELRVSRPTVTRWKNRQSIPHPALRSSIYALLKKRVDQTVRTLEKYSAGGGGEYSYVPAAAKGRE